MDASQKSDVNLTFDGWKNAGNLDYVSCWYKKAADLMQGTDIRSALVSTNSVSQGESVANLWKPLFGSGVHIDFAYRTFRWDSEAKIKAQVSLDSALRQIIKKKFCIPATVRRLSKISTGIC